MATPAVGTHRDAPPFKLPDIQKFGQDNSEFYSRYDALAEELDAKMVDRLKDQLDAHLIFAGLFAGVNSTFLALTLPLLNANPADDTNALLRENNAILLQLALNRNDSFPNANALPSETFSASGRLLTANILLSISLTFALMSSLFAVLGRQWLVDYRSHSGGGADVLREERMNRYLGARRWQLVRLLGDMIPALLQIALILFGISLTIYVDTLHPTLTKVVGAFIGAGIGVFVCTAIFAIWDPFCPFQTPLSRVITFFTRAAFREMTGLIKLTVLAAFSLIDFLSFTVGRPVIWVGSAIHVLVKQHQWTLELQRKAHASSFERLKRLRARFYRAFDKIFRRSQPSSNSVTPTKLEVEAVRRIICYSNDSATLITCITNILAMPNPQFLRRLSADPWFRNALIRVCRTAYREVLSLQGQDQAELATAVTWRYRAAIAHIGLSGFPFMNLIFPNAIPPSVGTDDEPGVSIPADLITASTPVLIDGYLAYAAVLAWYDVQKFGPSLSQTLETEFERLIDSNWKRISTMVMCIRVTCRHNIMAPVALRFAFSSKPSTILENLMLLLKRCKDSSCPAHTTSKKHLVHIFKFIGKAIIDSSDQSTFEINLIAKLLRLSEVFLRTEECPPEFSPVAQSLRRDLINALLSMCGENMDTDHGNDGSGAGLEIVGVWFRDLTGPKVPPGLKNTVDSLSWLFSNLTAGGDRLSILNADNLELVDLFSPVLQRLDELPLGSRFKVRVQRLRREFESFTSAVNRVAQSRDRDPSTEGITAAEE